jgi:proteasome accessory factor B
VQGEVRTDGRAGAYQVPEGTDLRALTQSLAPPTTERTATVLARPDAAHGLRRHARPVNGSGVPEGWERLEVTYGRTDAFADELLGYGPDVVIETPEDVRSLVLRQLEAVAGSPR